MARILTTTVKLLTHSGRVLELLKKSQRKNMPPLTPHEVRDHVCKAIMHLKLLCQELGLTLDDVYTANINKLKVLKYDDEA